MEATWYFSATSGVSSTSTLRNVQEDSNSPAISSNTGAIILHGIHQAAEKSTTISLSASLMSKSSKSLVVAICLTLVEDSPPLMFIGENEEDKADAGRDIEASVKVSSTAHEDEDPDDAEEDEEEGDAAASECLEEAIALERTLPEAPEAVEVETSSSATNVSKQM